MTGTFVATTPRDRMHPLAFQGILVTDCYAQLHELLRTRLGTGHTLLFAEPVADTGRDVIDWYSPVQGEVRPLAELPAERRQASLEEFRIKGEEIRKAAELLQQSDDSRRSMAGHMLALALNYPDESMLYVVGEQPVLVGWGFGPATAGAQPEHISRVRCSVSAAPASAASPPSQPDSPLAAPVERERRGVALWWWLLPLLLLCVLLPLLLVGWGGLPPLVPGLSFSGPSLCFMKPAADAEGLLEAEKALEAEKNRETSLLGELEKLRAQLAERAALCKAPAKTADPVPAPEEAAIPKLPPNELVIPELAREDDLSFMKGIWRCETGLINTARGTPVVLEYSFDAEGKGTITVDGDKGLCKASVTSSLKGEKLVIVTEDEIPCPTGAAYSGQQVECSGRDADAMCRGVNLSKGASPWNARFYRKR